jgi:hypothetical protein
MSDKVQFVIRFQRAGRDAGTLSDFYAAATQEQAQLNLRFARGQATRNCRYWAEAAA